MAKQETKHCRFCAELKSSKKLYNFSEGEEKHDEIMEKISFLNLPYIDLDNPYNVLPKTICYICYDSFNKTFEFLFSVKLSQDILKETLRKNETESHICSDDDDNISISDNFEAANTIQTNLNANELDNKESILNWSSIKQEEIKEESRSARTIRKSKRSLKRGVKKQEQTESFKVNNDTTGKYSTERVSPFLDTQSDDNLAYDIASDDKTWKDYVWLCGYCNIEFNELGLLHTHSKEVHKKCAAFRCIDCKRCKNSRYNDENDTFELFIKHVKRHRKYLKFYCHYCDTYFERVERLNSHLRQHTRNGYQSCSSCGEIIPNEDTYKSHLEEFKNVKPVRKMRRKRGTPITEEDLTCKICHKVYKNTNSLRDHTKLHVAERKKEYTCEVCGKAFFKKGNLQTHIQTHESVRPHVCKICSRAFSFIYELRKHVLLHSDVKPFACEECGRCFRQKKQLKAHKIVHSDIMPYSCQFCEKCFRFKQLLKVHERRHTGAQPYSCNHCAMKFTDWSNYNKHMKGRHGKDMSKKKMNQNGLYSINPETGQMTMADPAETEEWVNKIMIPLKRGKKTNKNKAQNLDGTNTNVIKSSEVINTKSNNSLLLQSNVSTNIPLTLHDPHDVSLQDDSI